MPQGTAAECERFLFIINTKKFEKPLDKIKKMVYYSFVAFLRRQNYQKYESEADKVYIFNYFYKQSYTMESVCKNISVLSVQA